MAGVDKMAAVDYSEYRAEFAEKGVLAVKARVDELNQTARNLLRDVLEDFPLEQAWADTTHSYSKTLCYKTNMKTGMFYYVMEMVSILALEHGLDWEYSVKTIGLERRVAVKITGLKRCKDCKCCAECGKQ